MMDLNHQDNEPLEQEEEEDSSGGPIFVPPPVPQPTDLTRLYSILHAKKEEAVLFTKEIKEKEEELLPVSTKKKDNEKEDEKEEEKPNPIVVTNDNNINESTTTTTTTTEPSSKEVDSPKKKKKKKKQVQEEEKEEVVVEVVTKNNEEEEDQKKKKQQQQQQEQEQKEFTSLFNQRLDSDSGMKRSSDKSSSLFLRKLPTDILLTPPPNFETTSAVDEEDDSSSYDEDDDAFNNTTGNSKWNLFWKQVCCFCCYYHPRDWVNLLCLSSKFKLRTQLMLSFGSVSIVTIVMVIAVCILVTYLAGENAKQVNFDAFTKQLVPDIQAVTVRYLAESLEKQFMPFDIVDIVEEATQDRLQGYPNSLLTTTTTTTTTMDNPQQQQQQQVPFKDIITGRHIYPIIGEQMFLDWQIPSDVTEDNFMEHVQESRWKGFYQSQRAVSTTSAVLVIQGVCDPNVTDPLLPSYWENCTTAHNDISTGGAIHPVPTAGPLLRASNDLIPLIKAIYETKEEIRDMGLYFASMGAGASFDFPAWPYSTQFNYTSVGCNWMKAPNPINPSLGPIGTQEEIERCHADGEVVSTRIYNPLERGWCRDQALNPRKIFLDSYIDAFNPGHWLLSIGRSIYDRQTNIFVGCMYIGMSLYLVEQRLKESLVTDNSALSLIRFDPNGTVLASTAADTTSGTTDSDVSYIDQLQVGLTVESYQSLYSMVDYDSVKPWKPNAIRKTYEEFTVQDEDFLVSVYPMPRLPDKYDRNYKPEFLVIMSTYKKDVFGGVDVLNDNVDDQVQKVVWFSLIAGAIGLCATLVILVSMSNTVTSPLRYINQATDDIVNSFGSNSNNNNNADEANISNNNKSEETTQVTKEQSNNHQKVEPKSLKFFAACTPKTELTDVLIEFNKMVASFSGGLLAKSEQGRRIEVRNRFELRKEFADLYESRKDANFPYNLDSVQPKEENGDNGSDNNFRNELGFVHIGSNLNRSRPAFGGRSKSKRFRPAKSFMEISKRGSTSRLFLWTVALIVTPLLLTSITISTVVYYTATKEFGDSVEDAKDYYIGVRLDALSVHAKLRADYVASLVDVSVRDIHLLTRYYGWLLFGGVKQADSFTEIMNGIEECKPYADDFYQCPHIKNNFVCDCAWNDDRTECANFPYGSRHLQRPQMMVQSTDAFLDGDRNYSSYPRTSTTPGATMWWDDIKSLPGWEKGSSASGHDTLYDRVRVSSAMPLFPVLYNYDRKENYMGQYIAFEADGLLIGYSGCNFVSLVGVSGWQSTEENGAAKIRPELCPVGKFGFDPRCREWYDTGRRLAIERNLTLHVTAPYVFVSNEVAQSATSALIDPRTGEHVAQVLIDFFSTSVFDALDDESTPLTTGGFPVLIAVQGDPSKDTVKGPGFVVGDAPKEVSEVMQPKDVEQFRTIVASMKEGDVQANSFTRVGENGKGIDTVHISYAPVVVKNIQPVNSSSFASGISLRDNLIYSLGLCETREGLLEPFVEIEKDMNRQIVWAIVILAVGILLAGLLIIYISCLVTTSIAEPMLDLLDLIRCINRCDFGDGPPKIIHSKGPKEIRNVSDTVIVLYKIVRAANDFFFSGELDKAYVVLVDALRLFRRLDNKKAVAVVSNNLGNTMLAMYREMKASEEEKYCGLTKQEIISHATGHFHEAITLGEKAYDEFMIGEGWTPNCLDFMQHLSNRYFNRALFLLMVKDDHEQPEKIVELGLRDLVISRDMDSEIVEYGQDLGFNRENRAHKLFYVDLVRSRGHNMLLQMGYPNEMMTDEGYPDDWKLGERLDDYFKLLQIENQRESSEVFKDVNVLGRLQEIETELMKYKMLTKDVKTAAKIAIRVLMEDQVVFVETLATSVDVLLAYILTADLDDMARPRVTRQLSSYTKKLDTDLESLEESTKGSARVSTLESLSEEMTGRILASLEGESSSMKMTSRLNWAKKEASGGFLTMEDF